MERVPTLGDHLPAPVAQGSTSSRKLDVSISMNAPQRSLATAVPSASTQEAPTSATVPRRDTCISSGRVASTSMSVKPSHAMAMQDAKTRLGRTDVLVVQGTPTVPMDVWTLMNASLPNLVLEKLHAPTFGGHLHANALQASPMYKQEVA